MYVVRLEDKSFHPFCSDRFVESEYCGRLADGQTSHGFCDQKEWPSPFTFFLNDVGQSSFFYCKHDIFALQSANSNLSQLNKQHKSGKYYQLLFIHFT